MRRPSSKPVRTTERYILDSLERTFGGKWVSPGHENYEPAPYVYEQPLYVTGSYLTVIGGQKYDEDALYDALEPYQHYIVGGGRGAESAIAKTYFEGEFTVIEPDPDLYGKNARKVNVEQVLSFAPDSPVLLVGNGERVKQAKAWLKRANWGREVHEIP